MCEKKIDKPVLETTIRVVDSWGLPRIGEKNRLSVFDTRPRVIDVIDITIDPKKVTEIK